MAGLGQVAFDGSVRRGAVFEGGGVGETGPRVVVTCLDGLEPGGLDRASGHGVQEANESLQVGEVVESGMVFLGQGLCGCAGRYGRRKWQRFRGVGKS